MATKERHSSLPPPTPIGMVICDFVHRDPGTGKAFLMGCFSDINATQFPATHPLMSVYVTLTDGYGKPEVKLVLIDVDEEREPICELLQVIDMPNPMDVIEIAFFIKNATFPEPGEYRFQLYGNDEFLMERRILINKLKVKK